MVWQHPRMLVHWLKRAWFPLGIVFPAQLAGAVSEGPAGKCLLPLQLSAEVRLVKLVAAVHVVG